MGEYKIIQEEKGINYYKVDSYNNQKFLSASYESVKGANGDNINTFKIFTNLINLSDKPKEPDYIIKIDTDLVNLIPKETYQIRFIFRNTPDPNSIYWVPYNTLLNLPYEIGISFKALLKFKKEPRASLIKNDKRLQTRKSNISQIKRNMAKDKKEYYQESLKSTGDLF